MTGNDEIEANVETRTAIIVCLGLLGAATTVSPSRVRAQAGPGPLAVPQSQSQVPPVQPAAPPKRQIVPPRKTLEGSWKINRDDSDDGRRKVQGANRTNTNNNPDPNSYPGGYPGGGYPGGPPIGGYPFPGSGGPYGGNRGNREAQNIEDNPKMQELIRPPDSLSFDLKDSEVDVTDDQVHTLVFYTDGRPLQKTTNNNRQEIAAHWNGGQLVSDEKSPLGGKMSRTFELSPDGRQFYETLHIDNGKSKSPLYIRYVYDVASGDIQSGPEPDPDRPVLKRKPDDAADSSQ